MHFLSILVAFVSRVYYNWTLVLALPFLFLLCLLFSSLFFVAIIYRIKYPDSAIQQLPEATYLTKTIAETEK